MRGMKGEVRGMRSEVREVRVNEQERAEKIDDGNRSNGLRRDTKR